MRLVSVDPGDRHVGIARFDGRELMGAWEIPPEELRPTLIAMQPAVVVVESFQLDPAKARFLTRRKMKTSEMIGEVRALSDVIGYEVVEQQSSVMKIAERCPLGRKTLYPKNRHARSAVLHGIYFLQFGPPKEKGEQ